MERVQLGNTGIEVSRLCFGSLTMTPFQANLSVREGAYLIEYAFDKGINFIDTAEIYENYDYIKTALKNINREDFHIATKTYAYTKEMAAKSLDLALKQLGTDYIDIFYCMNRKVSILLKDILKLLNISLKKRKREKSKA